MATVYGATIGSTWRSYLTYTVEETPIEYKITVDDIGFDDVSSTYNFEHSDTIKYTLKLGSNTYNYDRGPGGFDNDMSLSTLFTSSAKTLTISKTTSTQSITASFSIYTGIWMRWNAKNDTGNELTAATSTASVTLTIPAIKKPTVVLTALRDSKVETTVAFKAAVSSFSSDVISSVNLIVNGTTYSMGSGTVGSSGSLTFNKTLTGLPINRISASLVAKGKGGASDTYICNVPAAFYTLDIGNKGKEIAFGQSATTNQSMIPSNGLFSCGMDANFNGTININGIPIKGCHKIRTSATGAAGSYTYDSIGRDMVGSHTLYLEEKISEQQNGIILAWSFYENGKVWEWGWNFTVIPKTFISDNTGGGGMSTFMTETATFGNVGAKYINVRDDRIIGNDSNSASGTGTSGVKYYNNKFALRWVYGF